MAYPTIKLNQCDYAQITQNKTGDLAMVYKPLLNLVKDTTLGDFTTEKLKFDRYNFLDMLIVDEFDGSTNIIINDDSNEPRLINSGFSVQEDNTFLIPEYYTKSVTNIYDDEIFKQDTQLLKLYNNIPKLEFQGFGEGGFKCGSYVFYFRLADSVGNMSNVIQHSSNIQVFIGEYGSYKIRMGMEDELANKSIKFKLSNIDSGFDYIRVFYERTSSGADLANSTLFYMIDLNFPIDGGECILTLTGEEQILGISLADLKNEYADIASCKTQTIVDNTLFLANTSAYVHQYKELQHLAWCIYPTMSEISIELPTTDATGLAKGYYDPMNVYSKVGYWPDEYYRFGIVFIYNNNQLSPVFNIMGYDMSNTTNPIDQNNLPEFEPEDFIFNREIMSNSKGVVKTITNTDVTKVLSMNFHFDGLLTYIARTSDLTQTEKDSFKLDSSNPFSNYDIEKFLSERHGIKGFFFVRQKRIPTTIAQGLVVGLTTKEHGCIPILKNGLVWTTKSFLKNGRLVLDTGGNIETWNENIGQEDEVTRVVEQALLVPDAELLEATFNSIFTSQEFALYPLYTCDFNIKDTQNWWEYNTKKDLSKKEQLVKLTAVPKDTKLKTNGTDYFSTIAGSAEEAYKTEDIWHIWNKTKPLDLTVSDTLIRGRWGYFVGMSSNSFNFGDVVSIKKAGFINNPELNLLEFLERFNDYNFYSPISTRYSIDLLVKQDEFKEYSGDCFPSMFTHRMMSNFIDPELPTNDKIVNPGCWCENYAVRCTAEILSKTHSNLTGDSAGFYIQPDDTKDNIVSLIFGILTGNLAMIISSAQELANPNREDLDQALYANEVAQAFEVYVGDTTDPNNNWASNYGYIDEGTEKDAYSNVNSLLQAAKEGKIKKINPKEQEQNASGFNLKAIFKSDDKWELHGISQINRADVNAVSFGLWITFPIRSSLNLALRDVDYSQATEEAKFNKKRSFYPLENMDIKNKLPDSNVINGAAKKTIHKNSYPAYKTVPFMKQEYFNRIYWSKPNVADAFLNSYRMIYTDQYKEYNKEFGDITKILPLGNSLFVCFDHGMGVLPIDRTTKTEAEASPYLASRNVLPPQVQTLSKDFGSMWKNSVILTPKGLIYGVDTVAKKIWRTQGSLVEFISDHKVSKFLNEWIKLSEFDYKAYQGHLDVKTHYNNFKNDVIFTLVKDLPHYQIPDSNTKVYEDLLIYIRNTFNIPTTISDNSINIVIPPADNLGNSTLSITWTELLGNEEVLYEKYGDIQNGKIYINDIFTGIWCEVESWNPGTVWSMCYNEVLGKWTTFYDWYPVESCNVDNIFFTFDLELIDKVYDNNQIKNGIIYPKLDNSLSRTIQNKYFIDPTFTDKATVYRIPAGQTESFGSEKSYFSCYYKTSGTISITGNETGIYKKVSDGWIFLVWEISNSIMQLSSSSDIDIIEPKFFDLPIDPETNEQYSITKYISIHSKESESLKYYDIRDYNPNRMYLWKHGYGGLYNNLGKIKPTNWYGKQREFNFEFIVHDSSMILKIFNNLKMISNKTQPKKFEYEIVGESYEWWPYKPVIQWINEKTEEGLFATLLNGYQYILTNDVATIRSNVDYSDFPVTDLEYRSNISPYIYSKLPYLKIELTDKYGRLDKSYHSDAEDYWKLIRPRREVKPREHDYSFNTNETVIKHDEQLNEYRIHDEQLGNDMWKYGRVRGNMQYLEDYWNIEIRPVNFKWCYIKDEKILFKEISEARHRDKYIKIKVRYSGEDLAVILAIATLYNESYS